MVDNRQNMMKLRGQNGQNALFIVVLENEEDGKPLEAV